MQKTQPGINLCWLFSWPDFPYTTTNAGDTLFRGFTSAKRVALHEIQVDHAGEIGLTYYRMYQYTGDDRYKMAAFEPGRITLNGERIMKQPIPGKPGYTIRKLPNEGWSVIIARLKAGSVVITN